MPISIAGSDTFKEMVCCVMRNGMGMRNIDKRWLFVNKKIIILRKVGNTQLY